MKRTHIFSAAMSAAILVPILFFSSCQQREMELPDSETVPDVVIRARIEDPLTRTVLSGNDVSGYDVVWENGDEIVVTDAGVSDADAGSASAIASEAYAAHLAPLARREAMFMVGTLF